MFKGAVDGLRVLELHADLGRYTCRLFADGGAEVVKLRIESLSTREAPPYAESLNVLHTGESVTDVYLDAGKRVISLNVQSTSGSRLLQSLIEASDVLVTSLPLRTLDGLGLTPAQVKEWSPELIYLAVTPYGLTGPWSDFRATDLVILAAGGFLSLSGTEAGFPVRPFGDQSMYMASLHAWVAGLVALVDRDSTGAGMLVDVSAQEAVAYSLENAVQYWDLEGLVRAPRGSKPLEAGTGIFECCDGYVYVVAGMAGSILGWHRLIDWITDVGGDTYLSLRDEKWKTSTHRSSAAGIDEFAVMFDQFIDGRTRWELYEEGQTFGVSISPLLVPDEILTNPQLTERDYFVRYETPGGATVVTPGPAVRVSDLEVGDSQDVSRRSLVEEWTGLGASEINELLLAGTLRL